MASPDKTPLKAPTPQDPPEPRKAIPEPPSDDTDRDPMATTDAHTQPIIKTK